MAKFAYSEIGPEGLAYIYMSEQWDTRRLKGAWEALVDFEGQRPGAVLQTVAASWTHPGGGLYQYDPDHYDDNPALRDALAQYGVDRLAMLAAKRRK